MSQIKAGRLRELLCWNENENMFTRKVALSNRSHIGDIAGSHSHRGYQKVYVDGRRYYTHHLVWLYVTGDSPIGQIDHIDCDPANNRFSNLRLATLTENRANTHISTDNTSGFKGVSWDNPRNLWVSQLHHLGKHIFLGRFRTPEAAHAAYVAAAEKYFGSFTRTTKGLSQRQKELLA